MRPFCIKDRTLTDLVQNLLEVMVFWSEAYNMLSQYLRSLKPVFTAIFLVMAGGSLGALARYGTGLVAIKYFGIRFPYGTLIVNLTGCFLIGICFALVDKTTWLSPSARLFLMTGFLGALTTFSTYALETIVCLQSGTLSIAVFNFLLNNFLGMILVLSGIGVVQAGIGLLHFLVRP
jgi:fluoride exporter